MRKSLHLFPNIRATVKSLYSLPARPLTAGFIVFSRYMNSNANNITFCVTCVVERMVTTHFLNPLEGTASSLSLFTGDEDGDNFSAFCNVSVGSNQNKHVIFA